MTKLMKGLYTVGVAAVLAASAAPGQAADLKARVPFAFSVNGQELAAGTYDVSTSQSIVSVHGLTGGAIVQTNHLESATSTAPKLVFHRYGDTYVLRQVWTGQTGREVRGKREYPRRGEVAATFERIEIPLL
jgi:hypothetical protein